MARLPDEYQEVEYIEYIPSKIYCFRGFLSFEEAEKRISELQKQCPSISYSVGAQIEQKIKEYIIEIPEEAIAFLSDNEKRKVYPKPQPPLKCEDFVPTVYRFIEKEYVDKFFKSGNLKISNFTQCILLESKIRRDEKEGQGTSIAVEGNLRCKIGSCVGNNALLFCTSLSENNTLPDGTHYSEAIKIVNLNGFIDAVTKALIKCGYNVSVILKGPCIYNNRIIQREIHDQALSELTAEMENGSSFDFGKLVGLQQSISLNDLYFSKPLDKSVENEYRILWLLDKEPKDEPLYIDVPEAIQYCQKIVFDK